jgi:hypothetical protein
MPERHVKLPSGDKKMRIGLLIVAGLALIGFLVVAVVLPHMQGTEAKEAAQALIEGAEPAKQQVGMAAEKTGNVSGAGQSVKLASRNDPKHGDMKWIVSDNGVIHGWNEKNAIEIALVPSVQGGKASWNCKGYPVNAMPPNCGGR